MSPAVRPWHNVNMSFRLFIYYCALCGGWAALIGWVLGRVLLRDQTADGDNPVLAAGVKGLCLGMFVSLVLGVVDALWNMSLRRYFAVGARVLAAMVVGSVGGMLGGMLGQALFGWQQLPVFLIGGWAVTGLLIGASVGVFEAVASWLHRDRASGPLRKVVNGLLGGVLGGALGGFLSIQLREAWSHLFPDRAPDELWSPSASGFVALGLCIGLLIGLAQVILKEAWIRVETGRRAGWEIILSKPAITIGRAEACDLGLFGDNAIERAHARIVQRGGRYLVEDLDTSGGTFVNDLRIAEPTPLRTGDAIRVGNSLLRFGERRKRTAPA